MTVASDAITINRTRGRSRFFLCVAWLSVAVAVIGFARTFLLPLARGAFSGHAIVYIHAVMMFSWVLLFALQATLIRIRRPKLHRQFGWLALALAAGAAWSTVQVVASSVQRKLAAGAGPEAALELVGAWTTTLAFAVLLALAIIFRRRPDAHKRFMLLATAAILWPAWWRLRLYFPAVPYPDIVFALLASQLPVLILWLHDRLRLHRLHPVSLWAGSGLVGEQFLESVVLLDTDSWRALAQSLTGVFA